MVTVNLNLKEQIGRQRQVDPQPSNTLNTPYVNTIPPDHEPPSPGDLAMEKRIRRIIRWNALAMVLR